MIVLFTGFLTGLVHVWSGPDHLAAVAPLAARQSRRSWVPGARWGVGHSAGVALVGLLSLLLRDLVPKDLIANWGGRLVGIVLVIIGLWAMRKALRVHSHEHEHDGSRHLHLHTHTHAAPHEDPVAHGYHTHAALGIGILHGLAGSSHFLAVVPILTMQTRLAAICYLAAFAAGTIIAMATFSSAMGFIAGKFARRSADIYRGLMCFCASAAIVVGCIWFFS